MRLEVWATSSIDSVSSVSSNCGGSDDVNGGNSSSSSSCSNDGSNDVGSRRTSSSASLQRKQQAWVARAHSGRMSSEAIVVVEDVEDCDPTDSLQL